MADIKEKKVKVVKPKVDEKYKILTEGVYKIFDKTPTGSIRSKEAHALLDKLK